MDLENGVIRISPSEYEFPIWKYGRVILIPWHIVFALATSLIRYCALSAALHNFTALVFSYESAYVCFTWTYFHSYLVFGDNSAEFGVVESTYL